MKKYVFGLIFLGLIFSAFSLYGANLQNIKKMVLIKNDEDHYSFGIMVTNPDVLTLKKYHLSGGVKVMDVVKGSKAEQAGLKKEDIIIKFNGNAVNDAEDLIRLMRKIDEQKTVDIVVNRAGKELIFTARLKPIPDDADSNENEEEFEGTFPAQQWRQMLDSLPAFDFKAMPYLKALESKGGYLGVEVEDLNDQLLKYFKANYGVLVKRVLKNSPAQKAGIQAGDVIYKINDKKIKDTADLLRTVHYYDPGDKVDVYLIHKGKKKTVAVELSKYKGPHSWHQNFPWFWYNPQHWPMKNFRGHRLPPPKMDMFKPHRDRGIYKF